MESIIGTLFPYATEPATTTSYYPSLTVYMFSCNHRIILKDLSADAGASI